MLESRIKNFELFLFLNYIFIWGFVMGGLNDMELEIYLLLYGFWKLFKFFLVLN